MFKWIDNFLKPYQSENSYSVLQRVEELEKIIKDLKEENIETTNTLYEIMNSIDAVDARIDILTLEKWSDRNV